MKKTRFFFLSHFSYSFASSSPFFRWAHRTVWCLGIINKISKKKKRKNEKEEKNDDNDDDDDDENKSFFGIKLTKTMTTKKRTSLFLSLINNSNNREREKNEKTIRKERISFSNGDIK